jgi:hypothetical protein
LTCGAGKFSVAKSKLRTDGQEGFPHGACFLTSYIMPKLGHECMECINLTDDADDDEDGNEHSPSTKEEKFDDHLSDCQLQCLL